MWTRSGLVLLAILTASPAWSAALDYDATLTISLRLATVSTNPPPPAIVSFPVTGTGTASVNGSGSLGHLIGVSFGGASLATAMARSTLSTVAGTGPVPPLAGVQLTVVNGPAAFSGSGGSGFGGVMPLAGAARLCLFLPCSAAFVPANVSVPLSVVGIGGTANLSFTVFITVQGAPWTTGSVPFGSVSTAGFAHGPASASSSTAAVGGAARLVTPIFISTNIPALAVIPGLAVLDLRFVPEPGTLLLLGSGVATLLLMGRRRLTHR